MSRYHYGDLALTDAHTIAKGANAFLTALQEHCENAPQTETEKLNEKGVKLGDAILDLAQTVLSRGAFSQERYMSEILIYSAAIALDCEVCALTHIDSAVRARVPKKIINTVEMIALYNGSQAKDHTHLTFKSYKENWSRFEDWPRLSPDRETNRRFYNLIALLMSLVVRKQRLVRFHAKKLLTKTNVTPAEILEVAGIAQVMGGFIARWEIVHFFDVAQELLEKEKRLPASFVEVIELIPQAKR